MEWVDKIDLLEKDFVVKTLEEIVSILFKGKLLHQLSRLVR